MAVSPTGQCRRLWRGITSSRRQTVIRDDRPGSGLDELGSGPAGPSGALGADPQLRRWSGGCVDAGGGGRGRRPPRSRRCATSWGLDRLDRAVLSALTRSFGGGPVGVSTLAVAGRPMPSGPAIFEGGAGRRAWAQLDRRSSDPSWSDHRRSGDHRPTWLDGLCRAGQRFSRVELVDGRGPSWIVEAATRAGRRAASCRTARPLRGSRGCRRAWEPGVTAADFGRGARERRQRIGRPRRRAASCRTARPLRGSRGCRRAWEPGVTAADFGRANDGCDAEAGSGPPFFHVKK